jgi:hypothetical protein
VEIEGLEAFQARCPFFAPVLSDAEAERFFAAYADAMALPTPEARDEALRENVLEPMIERDQLLRACALYEQRRADGLLALGGRFNQGIRRPDSD